MIPYGRQNIIQDDIDEVIHVLQSDYLTQGPTIEKFEKAVAEYCGAKYAVAVCNATAALHIACLGLGLSSRKRLWTSPVSFVASSNCALYCGSKVDFVDIDLKTYNLSICDLERKLKEAQKSGELPDIVVPVHLAGQPCDMMAIKKLSEEFNFKILEDASHAIGGSYMQKKIGNCEFSDAAVFSFHPVKIVTTGEGGMIVTNNEDLYQKVCLLRSHGITRDEKLMTAKSHGLWYYQQIMLGYNYRMTDIQAALGLSQMKRINDFVARRHEIAEKYNAEFCEMPDIVQPFQHEDGFSAFHLYIIRTRGVGNMNHCDIFEYFRKKGIGVNLHYIPIYMQPYYRENGFAETKCENAEKYYAEAISLPMYYGLSVADQQYVIDSLKSLYTTNKKCIQNIENLIPMFKE